MSAKKSTQPSEWDNLNFLKILLREKNQELRKKDVIICNLREELRDRCDEIVFLKNEIDKFQQVVQPLTKQFIRKVDRTKRQAISAEPISHMLQIPQVPKSPK